MRLSDFWERMTAAFGPAYADSVARDHVMTELGGRTAHEAIAAGVDPRQVWTAICRSREVPSRLR